MRALAFRSLVYYWRTNLAVVAGVAIAVSVLAGALIVGESVRASLRELAVSRLGNTDHLVASTGFFRAQLAGDLTRAPALDGMLEGTAAIIAVDGLVEHAESRRRASGVAIYGVDARFFEFHGVALEGEPLSGREALVSPALAAEIGLEPGNAVLVRLRQPSAIPASSLHGRRDELGRTLRVTARATLPADRMGEFSVRPHQGEVRAIFLPLERLQRDLDRDGEVNALLVDARDGGPDVSAPLEGALARVMRLEDAGLSLRTLPGSGDATAPGIFAIESDSGLLTDPVAAAARRTVAPETDSAPVFSYLVDTIRVGAREIPYSVAAGIDPAKFAGLFGTEAERAVLEETAGTAGRPIWLNAWAAERLAARPGDPVTLVFDVWVDGGGIVSRTAELTLAGILPMAGLGADPTLTPDYPGISDQQSVADWDPPFPIDLSRITQADEDYWDRHRAAPKAFVPYALADELWSSRFGRMTSLRVRPPTPAPVEERAARLADGLTLADAGFIVQPVRARALEASEGTTDFGQYFLYFSFFLVVAGLLLTGLFFRLGVEQRLREIGLLEAIGLTPAAVRALFLREGLVLAAAGSLLGLLGALGYAGLIMLGLRTWWVGAVGTTALTLRPSAFALILGAGAGLITAVGVVFWMLRQAASAPVPRLLKGGLEADAPAGGVPPTLLGKGSAMRVAVGAALTAALLGAAAAGWLDATAGFFGAGAAALATALLALSWWLRRRPAAPSPGGSWTRLAHVGVSNASARPGRSVLSVALIAFATFVIVSVGAFRREDAGSPDDPKSGIGGYTLIAESVAPLMYDPAAPAGLEAYGLESRELQAALAGVTIDRFRLRPGDDGSCLNLYRPENPRILAPTSDWVERGGRFSFAATLAETEAERANPWLLLDRRFDDGSVPAIVDATSLQYVFHKSLGDVLDLERTEGDPVRLRFVASLSHSLFQSEVLVAEASFVRLFPEIEGYRVWLIDASPARAGAVTTLLEDRLSDFGVEVSGTAERLLAYQRVENTYLSTFQALGALGLVLGTFGLGAILVRNILERRREVALLQAVGYRTAHVRALVLSETALLVAAGLAIGAASALLAVQPALARQGGGIPILLLVSVFAAVGVAGAAASLVATAVATRLPLLAALKAE